MKKYFFNKIVGYQTYKKKVNILIFFLQKTNIAFVSMNMRPYYYRGTREWVYFITHLSNKKIVFFWYVIFEAFFRQNYK